MTETDAAAPNVVFGGTGHYGRHIVRELLARGEPVRVVSRNAERARKALGPEVAVVEGDITSAAVIGEGLSGARAAIVAVAAMTPKLIRRRQAIERDAVLAIFEGCATAGVSRLVYVSVYELDVAFLKANGLMEMGRNHIAVEAALSDSGLNWTVLGCSPSFEFFFTFLERKVCPGRGTRANPTIAPEDLGKVAAQAVLRDDLSGQRFRMTGPEALSFEDAAQRVAAITGEPLKLSHIPLGLVRVVGTLALPFTPFVRFIYQGMTLHDRFPEHLAESVGEDHQRLIDTFDFTPRTFDEAAKERFANTPV